MTWAWGLSDRRPAWQYVVPPLLLAGGIGIIAWPGLPSLVRGLGALAFVVAILAWGWKIDGELVARK